MKGFTMQKQVLNDQLLDQLQNGLQLELEEDLSPYTFSMDIEESVGEKITFGNGIRKYSDDILNCKDLLGATTIQIAPKTFPYKKQELQLLESIDDYSQYLTLGEEKEAADWKQSSSSYSQEQSNQTVKKQVELKILEHANKKQKAAVKVKKEKQIKKKKKNGQDYKTDKNKNLFPHSTRHIIQCAISLDYKERVTKLCAKKGACYQEFYTYLYDRRTWDIGLSLLGELLNFNLWSTESQKNIKEAFHTFYVWYMRNKYTLHIVQNDQMLYKPLYLSEKNKLIHLPNTRVKNENESTQFYSSSLDSLIIYRDNINI